MSTLELALTVLTGIVSTGGLVWWVSAHSHPELVHRNELELILRELTQLREAIDRLTKK